MSRYFIGIMTGTSIDAADAALVEFSDDRCRVAATARADIPPPLAATLTQLAEAETASITGLLRAQNELTLVCADAAGRLPTPPLPVEAIGCHGQTIRHLPAERLSWQLLNGALLAETLNTPVVCDFRARDLATGGDGAPLAPLFHRYFFAAHAPCDIINIGGIANITHLDADSGVAGYDTGPGMTLSDAWQRQACGRRFDEDGAFAAAGKCDENYLTTLLSHPYFRRPPPKSCGREEFSLAALPPPPSGISTEDMQATLLELTARTIAAAVQAQKVYICGGGGNNKTLLVRLAALLERPVTPTDEIGLAKESVEAATFAWLAKCHCDGEVLATTTVTGGSPRVAGAKYMSVNSGQKNRRQIPPRQLSLITE